MKQQNSAMHKLKKTYNTKRTKIVFRGLYKTRLFSLARGADETLPILRKRIRNSKHCDCCSFRLNQMSQNFFFHHE